MFELSAFQRDLLYVIAGSEKQKGLQIKDELSKCYSNDINHGRLYPNLDALVEMGLVEKGSLDRRSNYYDLTSLGRDKIEERREWESEYC